MKIPLDPTVVIDGEELWVDSVEFSALWERGLLIQHPKKRDVYVVPSGPSTDWARIILDEISNGEGIY